MGNCTTVSNLSDATMDNSPEFTLAGQQCKAKVIDVYDGDTLTLAFVFTGRIFQKKCRVYGIDCAEVRTRNKKEKTIGLDAKQFVSDLLLNKIIWVEFNQKDDKYGRLLGKIYPVKGGDTLASMLIAKGYGYEYHGEKKQRFGDWYTK